MEGVLSMGALPGGGSVLDGVAETLADADGLNWWCIKVEK